MIKKTYSILAENIRRARIQKKLSQEDLAEQAGISANYIYQIEAGRVQIGMAALLKIKEALDIPAEELFGEDEISMCHDEELKELLFDMESIDEKGREVIMKIDRKSVV